MLFAGVDVGSLSAETVLIDESRQIVSYAIVPTGAIVKKAAAKSLDEAISLAHEGETVAYTISTGYGRTKVTFAEANVTEISCHAKGIHHLFPGMRTLIDIGGQDSKVVKIDANGRVLAFHMNDKCAAGTGRFLEVMARALELDLDEMSEIGEDSETAISVNSTCTVFAESEVITMVAQEQPLSDIVRGINNSIADRIGPMLERLGFEKPVAMTGGVAKNIGVVRAIERRIGTSLVIPEEPQIIGALGAALFALERYLSGQSGQPRT